MSDLDIHGYLKITKLYEDGRKEVVLDDHNIIVSGMGLGLVYLFSTSGSTTIVDYQIDRYQLGVSGASSLEISSTYQLSAPLSSVNEYTGSNGKVQAFQALHLTNNTTTALETFVKIPFSQVARVNDNTVRYTFIVDRKSCNDLSRNGGNAQINEVGLYMRNPTGSLTSDKSVLVAYRSFESIRKTDKFSLLFDWIITF